MLCQSQLSTGKPQKPTLIYVDVQSQHTLAKWFFPVQQFCMSSYKVLSSLTQCVQWEILELLQNVCKFVSCSGINGLVLVCFNMLLRREAKTLMDREATGGSSSSSVISFISQ